MNFTDYLQTPTGKIRGGRLNEASKPKSPSELLKAYKAGKDREINQAFNISLEAEDYEEILTSALDDGQSLLEAMEDLCKKIAKDTFYEPDLDPEGIWDELVDFTKYQKYR